MTTDRTHLDENDDATQREADEFHRKLAGFLDADSINSATLEATARGDAYRATIEGEVPHDDSRLAVSETATGATPLAALAAAIRKLNWQ